MLNGTLESEDNENIFSFPKWKANQRTFLSIIIFFSILVYCLQPPTIEHARHSALPEQATFDLDATIQYNCHTGYVTNGFPRAKCLAIEGQASWYGPDITCERKWSN